MFRLLSFSPLVRFRIWVTTARSPIYNLPYGITKRLIKDTGEAATLERTTVRWQPPVTISSAILMRRILPSVSMEYITIDIAKLLELSNLEENFQLQKKRLVEV